MMYHDRKKGKYKTRAGMIESHEERDKKIVEYIEKGMMVSQVAKLTKVSNSVAMRIFNKNNGILPEPPKWNIHEALKMEESGESSYAISQYFGTCNKTVQRRLSEHSKKVDKKGGVENMKFDNVKPIGFMGLQA